MAKSRKWTDPNLPVWFDGTNINEAVFCDEFLSSHKIIYSNRAFFTPDGRVTDDLPLRGEIFERLKCCAVNNIPRKVSNILEVMKLAAQVEDFSPQPDRIHLSNGTLMLDGSFIPGKPEIVRSRLPVAYNPDAPKPALWLSFLDGLLYPEDIITLQEFIGYCLIPCNKGQRMMVIKGNGGEGKSQIGAVLGAMFGSNMKDGSIGKISENRFARADLEHILLCVDDDMEICHCRSTETRLIFKPYFWTKWKTKRSFLWSNMISRNHVSLKREPLLRNRSRFHRFKQRHTVSKTRRCRPVGRTS